MLALEGEETGAERRPRLVPLVEQRRTHWPVDMPSAVSAGICGLKGPVNIFDMHLELMEGIIRTTTSWRENWGNLVTFKFADALWISCLHFGENLAHFPFLPKLWMCL